MQYAVIRIDPVAMVEHFDDPFATEEAEAMHAKKYLMYLDHAMDLPFPTSQWFRFHVSPIATALPPKDPKRGITPDMSIPIFPNEDHPNGRAPIRTSAPFPFPNCYHWADSELTVRVRRHPEKKYDDRRAVKVSTMEHIRMARLLGDDGNRIDDYLDAKEAEELATRRAARAYSPSSQDSRLSATSGDVDMDFAGANGIHSPDADDDDDPCPENAWGAQFAESLMQLDILNLVHHDDDGEETLPLVDLWFDLDKHLSEGDIPSPSDLDKELDAVARIVQDARSRHPEVPFPRRNGTLGLGFEDDMCADEDEGDQEVYTNGVVEDDDEEVPPPASLAHPWSIPSKIFDRPTSACSSYDGSLSTSPNTHRRDIYMH
ncbi:uncharacterized protein TRAVEDRAFT_31308 [Trametes versicolor FP-101664 SS1]|uniref:uncharacterized protein n=1 Tax=Trametes versicolor (strain FP-101664) TaxID=717944 RepID=UPI000462359C|nr:uncharacterized protein TRAVEDRAFT_31308 [Trametes versicolor FP-101664 SS1]EIW54306.1 hypothetical protein TRAVEDRAFT_31308 [Trametes versicolor FP-101664 SS1]